MKEVESKDVPEVSGGQWTDGTIAIVNPILPILPDSELPDSMIPTAEQRQNV